MPKFMLFKFVILFQSFSHFQLLCSLSFHRCYCLATTLPSFSAIVISHTPLPFKTCQQIVPFPSVFAQFLTLFVIHDTTFISTSFALLCLSTFPTNIKLFFPRPFLLSALLTTQTKTLPQSHKLSSIYFNYIIFATFSQTVIYFPTSTPLQLFSTPPSTY